MAKEFGSLNNLLMSNTKNTPKPKVGMGVTILQWSDRTAATIVWVSESGKTIRLQEDNAVRTDKNGMSDCQTYTYTPNKSATIQTARLYPKGWKIVKGNRILIGKRDTYHDFSF